MHNPIILALDFPDLKRSLALARSLKTRVSCFKVGLELLTAEGVPQVLKAFAEEGLPVFADVKFSDIPNTISGATAALVRHPIRFFDVHASCGRESVQAAAQKKASAKLLVVTVLTSIDSAECSSLFGGGSLEKVGQWARMAEEAGADGVVCSPQELDLLSREGLQLTKVTPGVRPQWASMEDQKRAMTPKEAIEHGADYLVIGRPITNPPFGMEPVEAAQKILDEIGWRGK
ncbi:MAG: orotidine-5'-phosphate decarboxylase [Deltaproteobacteria bacterium]|nr:orotidine-5'-phosphate decarboxylase [Deltaproteobacteria bacterium]MBI3293903.1 orotidine-5'-phosphate decarboxylase [Deltaproteobacteria bacterium]